MFFTGAWSALMVNEAAPPWASVVVLPVMVRVGRTWDVMVTVALLGEPTTYDELGASETVRILFGSTTLLVTVGICTVTDVCPAGTTMFPAGRV